MTTKKHLDWKRIGWTAGILAYLFIGIFITYHFYAQHWERTTWVLNDSVVEPGTYHSMDDFYDLKQVPQLFIWKILGSLGITIATPVALTCALGILWGFLWLFWEMLKSLGNFFYHNGKEEQK